MTFNSPDNYPMSRFKGASFVPPEGSTDAKIMIIGEAPGKNEDKEGTPFVGMAGKVLNSLLYKAGLTRGDCWITNVLKYKPPANDITIPTAQFSIQENIPALMREVRAVKPRVIVPMGNIALQALGYNYKISRARGSVLQSQHGKIIPTFHPASVFHERKESDRYFTMNKDWLKIARHVETTHIPQPSEKQFELNPTVNDIELFATHVKSLVRGGVNVSLGVDIETYYVDNIMEAPLKTIGIAINTTKCIVIPFIDESHQYVWNKEDAKRVIMAVGSLLEDASIEKMYHNALFDIPVLLNHGFNHRGPVYDTMIARSLIYHPAPDSLEYLVSIYTDYEPWKLKQEHGDAGIRIYNARDCVVMKLARPGLDEDLADNKLKYIANIVMQSIEPYAYMMCNGVKIDSGKYQEVKEKLEADIKSIRETITKESGRPNFNPDSPNQVRDLLFKQLKLKSQVKTASGEKSTSEDVLNRLSLRYPDNVIINELLKFREYGTRYKTFVKNLPIMPDGYVHPSVSLTRAVTGRAALSKPPIHSLPKRKDPDGYIRGMYVASPGKAIVGADYKQIELYVYAVLAEDKIWLDAFKNGDDIHAINSKALLGFYDKKYRTFVKNFIYGLIYGSEGQEIAKVAPKELIEQLTIQDMLHSLQREHPWLFRFREKVEESIQTRKYITNAFNRRRYYPNKPTKADLRSGVNFPIQSTVADIMNMKAREIHESLNDGESMLVQWHDAFYLEVPVVKREAAGEKLKKVMESPIESPLGYYFKPMVDVEYGKSLKMSEL